MESGPRCWSTETLCRLTMTASDATNSGGEKSTPTRSTDTAAQLLRSIETAGGVITMAGLRARTSLSEVVLRQHLDQLQREGRIAVATGYERVRIRLCDDIGGRAD